MNFQARSFHIDISPENTKNVIYKGKSIPIDYDLLKRNSFYFRKNDKNYYNKYQIQLLEEEKDSIEFPIGSIQEFVRCCQNQEIEINSSNIFYLNYLAKKYEVQKLENATMEIISSSKNELALESLLFILNISNKKESAFVDTINEEKLISANFEQYMKDERILEVPIPILYRIVRNYYSDKTKIDKNNTNDDKNNANDDKNNANNNKNNSNDDFVDFLFKIFDKNGTKASLFLEFFDINKSRMKDLVKLHDSYSFDPKFFNESLFDTTIELIKEMVNLKKEFTNELSEMKKFFEYQKTHLSNVKTEIEQMTTSKIQSLLNEVREIKFCVDQSNKKPLPLNIDFTLPYDAYICVEMEAQGNGNCYLFVNDVVVLRQGAQSGILCKSPISIICKKGDKIKLSKSGSYACFYDPCYFGLK